MKNYRSKDRGEDMQFHDKKNEKKNMKSYF